MPLPLLFWLGCGACASNSAPDIGAKLYEVGDAAPAELDASSGVGTRFRGEAWADNWFSASIGTTLIAEDSVPITTERSFNAERFDFEAEYPFVLAFILKDFKENDSGLEYIGKANQQMGDGGFIFQLTDLNRGTIVLVSGPAWRCHAIHRAPLNKSCEHDPQPELTCQSEIEAEPAHWTAADFDDSAWGSAVAFSAAEVGPKDGYNDVSWSPDANFIWTSDLETDNTVLCRARVESP